MPNIPSPSVCPYKIVVNSDEVQESRNWCINHLGKIPLKKVRKVEVYNTETCTWLHRLRDSKMCRIFYFQEWSDALHFALSRHTTPTIHKR